MRKHILCGLQLRCSKMRFPCHGRNSQCVVLHFFADRYLGESHIEVMLFLVQLLKISRFVLKQLGSKASQVLRNQVCVFAWQKHQPVGGKKFEKLSKSHQFQATVEPLIAFRCLPLNAQWLCHQKEGRSDLCRCWRCRRPEWSWDGLE